MDKVSICMCECACVQCVFVCMRARARASVSVLACVFVRKAFARFLETESLEQDIIDPLLLMAKEACMT